MGKPLSQNPAAIRKRLSRATASMEQKKRETERSRIRRQNLTLEAVEANRIRQRLVTRARREQLSIESLEEKRMRNTLMARLRRQRVTNTKKYVSEFQLQLDDRKNRREELSKRITDCANAKVDVIRLTSLDAMVAVDLFKPQILNSMVMPEQSIGPISKTKLIVKNYFLTDTLLQELSVRQIFKSSDYPHEPDVIDLEEASTSTDITTSTSGEGELKNTQSVQLTNPVGNYDCYFCPAVFTTGRVRTAHLKRLHVPDWRNSKVSCEFCPDILNSRTDFVNHLKKHTEEKERTAEGTIFFYQCDHPKCLLEFRKKSQLIQHLSKAHSSDVFKCKDCDRSFCMQQNYDLHLSKIHSDTSSSVGCPFIDCPFCPGIFLSSEFWKHLNLHSLNWNEDENETGEVLCDLCGKVLSNEMLLRKHTRAVHKTEFVPLPNTLKASLDCQVCSKRCTNGKASLQRHYLRYHTYEHGTICYLCNRHFKTISCLYIHLKRHTGMAILTNRHHCNYCTKFFTGSITRNRHHVLAHPDKCLALRPFYCIVCFSTFSTKEENDIHYEGHLKWKCPKCSLHHLSQRAFQVHMDAHARPGNHAGMISRAGRLSRMEAILKEVGDPIDSLQPPLIGPETHRKEILRRLKSNKDNYVFCCKLFPDEIKSQTLDSTLKQFETTTTEQEVTENLVEKEITVKKKYGKDLKEDHTSIVIRKNTPYFCKLCAESLPTRESVLMHQSQKHGSSRTNEGLTSLHEKRIVNLYENPKYDPKVRFVSIFKCNLCGAMFYSVAQAVNHRSIHETREVTSPSSILEEEYTFQCNECPRKFRAERHVVLHKLRSHQGTDSGMDQLTTEGDSQGEVVAKDQMETPVTQTKESNKWPCKQCHFSFSKIDKLMNHIRKSHMKSYHNPNPNRLIDYVREKNRRQYAASIKYKLKDTRNDEAELQQVEQGDKVGMALPNSDGSLPVIINANNGDGSLPVIINANNGDGSLPMIINANATQSEQTDQSTEFATRNGIKVLQTRRARLFLPEQEDEDPLQSSEAQVSAPDVDSPVSSVDIVETTNWPCKNCEFSFKTPEELVEHNRKWHLSRKTFMSAEELKQQKREAWRLAYRRRRDREKIKLPDKSKIRPQATESSTFLVPGRWPCGHCEFMCFTQQSLLDHFQKEHMGLIRRASGGRVVETVLPVQILEEDEHWPCKQCQDSFSSADELMAHIRALHIKGIVFGRKKQIFSKNDRCDKPVNFASVTNRITQTMTEDPLNGTVADIPVVTLDSPDVTVVKPVNLSTILGFDDTPQFLSKLSPVPTNFNDLIDPFLSEEMIGIEMKEVKFSQEQDFFEDEFFVPENDSFHTDTPNVTTGNDSTESELSTPAAQKRLKMMLLRSKYRPSRCSKVWTKYQRLMKSRLIKSLTRGINQESKKIFSSLPFAFLVLPKVTIDSQNEEDKMEDQRQLLDTLQNLSPSNTTAVELLTSHIKVKDQHKMNLMLLRRRPSTNSELWTKIQEEMKCRVTKLVTRGISKETSDMFEAIPFAFLTLPKIAVVMGSTGDEELKLLQSEPLVTETLPKSTGSGRKRKRNPKSILNSKKKKKVVGDKSRNRSKCSRKHVTTEHKAEPESEIEAQELFDEDDRDNDSDWNPNQEEAKKKRVNSRTKRESGKVQEVGDKENVPKEALVTENDLRSAPSSSSSEDEGEVEGEDDVTKKRNKNGRKIRQQKNIYRTRRKVVEGKVYKCRVCNETFGGQWQVWRHRTLTHPEKADLTCKLCQKVFPTYNEMIEHRNTTHAQHRCKICRMSFLKREFLLGHIERAHNGNPRPYKCEHCDNDYGEHYHLVNHLTRAHGIFNIGSKNTVYERKLRIHSSCTYPCDFCKMVFTGRRRYNTHIRRHLHRPEAEAAGLTETSVFPTFLCDFPGCKYMLRGTDRLLSHLQQHCTNSGPFCCTQCNRVFAEEKHLEKHVHNVHPETAREFNLWECPFCIEVFETEELCSEHQTLHIVDLSEPLQGEHMCDVCGKNLSSIPGLNAHILQFHGDNHYLDPRRKPRLTFKPVPQKCAVCDQEFGRITSRQYEDHMDSHTYEHGLECCFCSMKEIYTRSVLVIHLTTKHKEESSSLLQVKAPRQRDKMKGWKSIFKYVNSKKKRCNLCEAKVTSGTKYKHLYTSHQAEFLRDYTYFCDVCYSPAESPEGVARHRQTIHDKWKCQICSKQFLRSDYFRTHMLSHEGSKPFQCSVCEKYFTTRMILREHMHRHEKKYTVFCSICPNNSVGFYRNCHLEQHIQSVHINGDGMPKRRGRRPGARNRLKKKLEKSESDGETSVTEGE